jgi:hypothetical protein
MGHGGVYTPQIVVDGVQDVMAAAYAIAAAIEARAQAIVPNCDRRRTKWRSQRDGIVWRHP